MHLEMDAGQIAPYVALSTAHYILLVFLALVSFVWYKY